jgi:threonine dehydratase
VIELKDIEAARERIEDRVIVTPCTKSESFSVLTNAQTFFKFENLQFTGSFKERGALNKILTLTPEERARGVIAASAGNHAQGVAYHAGRLGIPATIVMPEPTPLIKVQNTRNFGAKVVLSGRNFDEAYFQAVAIQEREGSTFVHPFDDDQVIAGQGTIGLELLEQNPYLQAVIVPIGGGGLISGIALAVKEVNPRIQVIGVETAVLPSMQKSVAEGHPVTLEPAVTLADGIAVKRPGERTLEVVRRYVDDIVTVDEEEIANAILLLLEREKTVVEGAGAVPVAALLHDRIPSARGKRVAMVLSGGNIDVNVLSRVIERGLVKDGRRIRLVVRVQDRPGFLARLMATVAELGANVVEVYHHRAFATGAAVYETEVELTLETRGHDHMEGILRALKETGYQLVGR